MKTFDQWVALQETNFGDTTRSPIDAMSQFKKYLQLAKAKGPAVYDALMTDYNQHKDPSQSIRFAQNSLGISGDRADFVAQGGKPLRSPAAPSITKNPYKARLLRGRKDQEAGGRNPFGG